MKLKFSIRYGTQWGESLFVAITYKSADGTEKASRLMMGTADGWQWELETSVLESRQHPIDSFVYHYEVEGWDGRLLRREWTLIPRCYHFEASCNYVLADQWREIPLQLHLYSEAYLTVARFPRGEEVRPMRVPLYRKTIVFRVSAPQLRQGQSLAILGSHPALGNWNTARYLKMEYMGRYDWMLSVNADVVMLPIEYKYVVVDDTTHTMVSWEEGDNRAVDDSASLSIRHGQLQEGTVLVVYGENLRIKEQTWRAAGVVVPVFSLRSAHSCGVGDFGDLRLLVDWAVATGMKVIQILPVNDTTRSHAWSDSYPYNIVSAFALHPQYLDLEALGTLKDKDRMTAFRRQCQELNALDYSDYEAVERVKGEYVRMLFAEKGKAVLDTSEFRQWLAGNREWLEPYARWIRGMDLPPVSHGWAGNVVADAENDGSGMDVDSEIGLVFYVQYHLHLQLKSAADYARSHGIVIKGDVPIGVSRDSVETATHPELFHLDCQTGAPPDAFSRNGQNWGFPTYRWEHEGLTDWFRRRLHWMEQYFDAIRIDHILGFFRIWEIPADAVLGLMGHFSPSLPMTVSEIEYFGLTFRQELFTRPFIDDQVLGRLFGMHASHVREHFLVPRSHGSYDLKTDYDTQQKVCRHFEGRSDEDSLWIRDGLCRLISGVLFLEDVRQPGMFHPRIGAFQEPVFDALSADEKDAYMRLYNHYFYQRHHFFWESTALRRLTDVFGDTRMLCCGEDLGMLPDCVASVLDRLRVLTLEIQSMPKQDGLEFAHLDGNPYRSVATFATHDMPPLRLWWEESPERAQRYYVTMLQKQGRAPEHLSAHLAEEIIARHLYCPSMLCLLSIQDWLAMDSELRSEQVRGERINVPSDPCNQWKYRMHLSLEELLKARHLNDKIKMMITRSKR